MQASRHRPGCEAPSALACLLVDALLHAGIRPHMLRLRQAHATVRARVRLQRTQQCAPEPSAAAAAGGGLSPPAAPSWSRLEEWGASCRALLMHVWLPSLGTPTLCVRPPASLPPAPAPTPLPPQAPGIQRGRLPGHRVASDAERGRERTGSLQAHAARGAARRLGGRGGGQVVTPWGGAAGVRQCAAWGPFHCEPMPVQASC